jgi:hypothetical protein
MHKGIINHLVSIPTTTVIVDHHDHHSATFLMEQMANNRKITSSVYEPDYTLFPSLELY